MEYLDDIIAGRLFELPVLRILVDAIHCSKSAEYRAGIFH